MRFAAPDVNRISRFANAGSRQRRGDTNRRPSVTGRYSQCRRECGEAASRVTTYRHHNDKPRGVNGDCRQHNTTPDDAPRSHVASLRP